MGIDDIAMTNVGKHRIQTKSGNLNSTLVHMDSDGIPASPPRTTKPVAAGYGAHPAPPQSHDAAAMNVRHIQVRCFCPSGQCESCCLHVCQKLVTCRGENV